MLKRNITTLITRSLRQFPAVLVIGARQMGKSTLVQQLVERGLVQNYATLDDLATLMAARQDPDGFLANYQTSLL